MLVLSAEPPIRVKLIVRSTQASGDVDENQQLWCELVFEPPPKYPDEPPHLYIEESHNLDEDNMQSLVEHLQQLVRSPRFHIDILLSKLIFCIEITGFRTLRYSNDI